MVHELRSAKLAFCFVLGAALSACGESQVAADTVQEAGTDAEAGDSGSQCLPDPDASVAQDAALESEVGAEGGGDDTGTDTDADVDAGHELGDCPDDMVAVGPVCVDVYEASRPDATAVDQGSATGPARSVAGVIPWHVNPMTLDRLAEFEAACNAAGKRLCESSEWLATCEGPSASTYVFGDSFDREICNCVDTFCDDWCDDNGIDPSECVTDANCGYTYDCYRVMPTGSFSGCTSDLGTFDVTGNVWEVVPSSTDGRGFEVRGGAYNCAGAEARLQCTFNAVWDALYAGFRCCMDRPASPDAG